MAVVVALSEEFNKQIGEKATQELAEWMNNMDNDVRIDTKGLVDQNFTLLRAEIAAEFKAFRAEMDAKFDAFRVELATFQTKLTWQMVVFWLANAALKELRAPKDSSIPPSPPC